MDGILSVASVSFNELAGLEVAIDGNGPENMDASRGRRANEIEDDLEGECKVKHPFNHNTTSDANKSSSNTTNPRQNSATSGTSSLKAKQTPYPKMPPGNTRRQGNHI